MSAKVLFANIISSGGNGMRITTQAIEELVEVEDTYFEGCSEAPCGCDRCCDKVGEAHHLAGYPTPKVVTNVRELLLTD